MNYKSILLLFSILAILIFCSSDVFAVGRCVGSVQVPCSCFDSEAACDNEGCIWGTSPGGEEFCRVDYCPFEFNDLTGHAGCYCSDGYPFPACEVCGNWWVDYFGGPVYKELLGSYEGVYLGGCTCSQIIEDNADLNTCRPSSPGQVVDDFTCGMLSGSEGACNNWRSSFGLTCAEIIGGCRWVDDAGSCPVRCKDVGESVWGGDGQCCPGLVDDGGYCVCPDVTGNVKCNQIPSVNNAFCSSLGCGNVNAGHCTGNNFALNNECSNATSSAACIMSGCSLELGDICGTSETNMSWCFSKTNAQHEYCDNNSNMCTLMALPSVPGLPNPLRRNSVFCGAQIEDISGYAYQNDINGNVNYCSLPIDPMGGRSRNYTSNCGNRICELLLENPYNCGMDCSLVETCGDGLCFGAFENVTNCGADCSTCGDGICSGACDCAIDCCIITNVTIANDCVGGVCCINNTLSVNVTYIGNCSLANTSITEYTDNKTVGTSCGIRYSGIQMQGMNKTGVFGSNGGSIKFDYIIPNVPLACNKSIIQNLTSTLWTVVSPATKYAASRDYKTNLTPIILRDCTYVYIPPACNITNITIIPGINCTGNICYQGSKLNVSVNYTGNCSLGQLIQIDYTTSNNICKIQHSGVEMQGINLSTNFVNGGLRFQYTIPPVPLNCTNINLTNVSSIIYNQTNIADAAWITPLFMKNISGIRFSQCFGVYVNKSGYNVTNSTNPAGCFFQSCYNNYTAKKVYVLNNEEVKCNLNNTNCTIARMDATAFNNRAQIGIYTSGVLLYKNHTVEYQFYNCTTNDSICADQYSENSIDTNCGIYNGICRQNNLIDPNCNYNLTNVSMKCGNISGFLNATLRRPVIGIACNASTPTPTMDCITKTDCVYEDSENNKQCYAITATQFQVLTNISEKIGCRQNNTWCPEGFRYNGTTCIPQFEACDSGLIGQLRYDCSVPINCTRMIFNATTNRFIRNESCDAGDYLRPRIVEFEFGNANAYQDWYAIIRMKPKIGCAFTTDDENNRTYQYCALSQQWDNYQIYQKVNLIIN